MVKNCLRVAARTNCLHEHAAMVATNRTPTENSVLYVRKRILNRKPLRRASKIRAVCYRPCESP
ncbi:hypothetical protein J2X98_003199 [Pseudarthrobacter enclensis]|uniref:Uncharacterized protein n=1 Tax=Pseudarthrobacter enclensis TaxID=993070 RepID=A0ABT9RWH4_9MICC|nr:hypothetical protein [Pseudarthrobacter enclensis]